jgi:hypothetical protein
MGHAEVPGALVDLPALLPEMRPMSSEAVQTYPSRVLCASGRVQLDEVLESVDVIECVRALRCLAALRAPDLLVRRLGLSAGAS